MLPSLPGRLHQIRCPTPATTRACPASTGAGYFCAPRGSCLSSCCSPCEHLGSCCAPQQLPKGLSILQSLGLLLQVRPAVNQVEVHPYFRNQALIDYCAKEGVHVTAYSSLGTPSSAGHLVKKSAPNPSHVSGSGLDCDPFLLRRRWAQAT